MTFNDLINRIRRYNSPMADKIIALRKKYNMLYELDALSFEHILKKTITIGNIDGDFQTREQSLKVLEDFKSK